MTRWICAPCGYAYDPAFAFLAHGVAPGTRLDDLPDDWRCPECGAPKDEFLALDADEEKRVETPLLPLCRAESRFLFGAA